MCICESNHDNFLTVTVILFGLPTLAANTCIPTLYNRGAQPFWAKGRSVLFLVHSRAEEKNYKLNFQESSVKNRICFILLAFLLLLVWYCSYQSCFGL